jgi:hypothetical protein
MAFTALVSPSTSGLKQPLSYEEDFQEALVAACQKLAALCVELLVERYNHQQPDMSFADYLVNEVRTLLVLEPLRLNVAGLKRMDLNDDQLGSYIEARLKDLALIWETPDLARIVLTKGGYATALRFFKR